MRVLLSLLAISSLLGVATAACGDSDSASGAPDAGTDASLDVGAGDARLDTNVVDSAVTDTSPPTDAGIEAARSDAADAADASVVIPPGFVTPIGYKSFADSPLKNVAFPSYFHLEDWEDSLVNTPGVTPSSTAVGSSFGALVDSVDGDDGAVDGKCAKDGGICDSGFSGGGTIEFTFDAAALGALPTHVGIAWTDGSPGCDAVFDAYDATGTLIGTRTAAAVGDGTNTGSVDEDRFFAVVHTTGVKKIVVKSSSGGVEVDHLQYGR